MAQSLSKLFVHIVFHTKHSKKIIKTDIKSELFAYMASIIKDNESIPIIINGVEDHVHILCVMSKNIALSKLVELVKRHSSRWIKTKDSHYQNFGWQNGYAGFSVSYSSHDVIKSYIANQVNHHKTKTFKDEYLELLKIHGIDFNEDYLWTD
ncbi:MAG: IS200/IS605 family transposase [Bacteroidales bacterium]|nr:IS200/IS605 family transposase [Bacteroidales bacterium]